MTEIETRILELLKNLILIPSTASNPDGLSHAVRLVRNHIESIPSVKIEDYTSGGRPSFLARPRHLDNLNNVQVLLVGHVDVVEASPEDFHPRTEGNRLYGRGAGDMKGQVALITELFKQFLSSHPNLPIGLMITSDEESGGKHGVDYLVNEKGCRPGLAIIPDSGSLNEIVRMEKGVITGRLVSKGSSGHSARPWACDNAAHRLMKNIMSLTNHFSNFKLSETEKKIGHWHHTISINTLKTENTTPNSVPGSAEAVIDIRFTEVKTADNMIAMVNELLDSKTVFHPEFTSEPLITEPDPVFLKITEQITGRPVKLVREHGGSDGRFFTMLKIPVIMSRPKVGGLHSDNEWIEIDSMLKYYQIVAAYLREKLSNGIQDSI